MNAIEVLFRAADHIETYGWHQGTSYADVPDGEPTANYPGFKISACCTIGAFGVVLDGVPTGLENKLYSEARQILMDYLWLDQECNLSVAQWNDLPGQTKGNVVSALRAAARAADQGRAIPEQRVL
jgi:hypothetical protein